MAYSSESQAKSAIIRGPCFHSYPVPLAIASSPPSLADTIEDLLPQTQCTKCGYAGCRPYAEAIADGTASYDQCPPGGAEGVARLAALLGKPPIPLNTVHGFERPRPVARIDETVCIGCTLCIQACPVDAIAGAAKRMHTVIESLCTGCDLCVAPCPVDCIDMIPVTGAATGWNAWTQAQADTARAQHDHRLERQQHEREAAEHRAALRHAAHLAQAGGTVSGAGTAETEPGMARASDTAAGPLVPAAVVQGEAAGQAALDAVPAALSPDERKRAIIQAALERARVKKAELVAHGLAPKNTVAVSAAVQAQIDEADARRKRLGIHSNPDADVDANPNASPGADPDPNPNPNPGLTS
jgi:electron transport complex protein RnfB